MKFAAYTVLLVVVGLVVLAAFLIALVLYLQPAWESFYLRFILRCKNCGARPYPWTSVRVTERHWTEPYEVYDESGYISRVSSICDRCFELSEGYKKIDIQKQEARKQKRHEEWLSSKGPAFEQWFRSAPPFPHAPEECSKAIWDRTEYKGPRTIWLNCSHNEQGSIEVLSLGDALAFWTGRPEPPANHKNALSHRNRYLDDVDDYTGSVFKLGDGTIVFHWHHAGSKCY